jgi:TrpR-related protein YerC/YecD
MNKFKFNKNTDNLFEAVLSLKNIKEAEKFFRDLCTVDELREMSDRWAIVRMLNKKMTYREIAEKMKVSTTTVSRVASWINEGEGGYGLILRRIANHHDSSISKKS